MNLLIVFLLFIISLHYIYNIFNPRILFYFLVINTLSLFMLEGNYIHCLDFIFPEYIGVESENLLFFIILSFINLFLVFLSLQHEFTKLKENVVGDFSKYNIRLYFKWISLLFFILNLFVYPLFFVKWSSAIGIDIFYITSFHIDFFEAMEKISFSFVVALYSVFLFFIIAIIILLYYLIISEAKLKGARTILIFFSALFNLIYFNMAYDQLVNIFSINSQKKLLIESSYNIIPDRCKNTLNLESGKSAEQEGFKHIKFIDGSTVSLAKRDNEKNDYKFAVGHCYNDKQGYYKLLKN